MEDNNIYSTLIDQHQVVGQNVLIKRNQITKMVAKIGSTIEALQNQEIQGNTDSLSKQANINFLISLQKDIVKLNVI